jgi:hypothetical protein
MSWVFVAEAFRCAHSHRCARSPWLCACVCRGGPKHGVGGKKSRAGPLQGTEMSLRFGDARVGLLGLQCSAGALLRDSSNLLNK